jgi:hypothetical protein
MAKYEYFVTYSVRGKHYNINVERSGPICHIGEILEMERFIETDRVVNDVSITGWQIWESPQDDSEIPETTEHTGPSLRDLPIAELQDGLVETKVTTEDADSSASSEPLETT